MNSNIPPSIYNKMGQCLYNIDNHPICILKKKIFDYFSDLPKLEINSPYISVKNNFDRLLIPLNHPSRSPSDTFYRSEDEVLRTHMTCYLYPLAKSNNGHSQLKYIICGDVYRKDEIDASHYPVFHQIDAFSIVPDNVDVKEDLRNRLSGMIEHLLGKDAQYRFVEEKDDKDVYFPFTTDSIEAVATINVFGQPKEIELLGAGTVHPEIMNNLGLPDHKAWAFGLGLERLAMAMFDIPDIRLFWSHDKRFLSQFNQNTITKFKPFSKHEACYKDVSFFLGPSFSYNDFCTIVRDVDTANVVESIKLLDEFNKNGRISHCYRITYRSMDKTLKNSEINAIQKIIVERITNELGVEVR